MRTDHFLMNAFLPKTGQKSLISRVFERPLELEYYWEFILEKKNSLLFMSHITIKMKKNATPPLWPGFNPREGR